MRGRDEKDLPAEQIGKEAPTRIPRENGNRRGPQDYRCSKKKRTTRSHSLKNKLSQADFLKLKKEGMRCTGEVCRFSFLFTSSPRPRLGLTVTKKFGKAHDRNRFKRWCRELFRNSNHHFLKGVEINISPALQSTAVTFKQMKQDFQTLLYEIQQRAISSHQNR